MQIKLALLGTLLMLTSCGGHTQGPIIDTACNWVRPIYIGKSDVLTPPTAAEILAHNLKWQRNCPRKGSKK